MSIWGLTALVFGAIVLASVLVAWIGLRIQRRLQRSSPDSPTLQPVTFVGGLWQALFVLYLVGAVSIYHLAPETTIGSYLHTWVGAVLAFVIGFIVFSLLGAVLTLKGYPLSRRGAKVVSNSTPHSDARDVPAPASGGDARAGGRER